MSKWRYTKGLKDIGNGVWAYLQPDGSWGWSNAGLIVDGDQTLLVDTLFDLKLTAEMLAEMRRSVPAAAHINTLFNTHHNGDHTFGNQLVEGAEIVATQATFDEMDPDPSRALPLDDGQRPSARARRRIPRRAVQAVRFHRRRAAEAEPHLQRRTRAQGRRQDRAPDRAWTRAHPRRHGGACVPEDRVVFTGDLLFNEGTPIAWAGPVSNWVRACDRILAMDVDVIVPGHGPIATSRRFAR